MPTMTNATRTLLLSAALLVPSLALAEDLQITLTDHRGRVIDGQVVATPSGGGAAIRCTTRGGRCTLRTKAGTYSVRATPLAGGSVPAKNVTVRAGRAASASLQAPAPGAGAGAGAGAGGGTAGGSSTGSTQGGTDDGGSGGGSSGGTTSSENQGARTDSGGVPDIGSGRIARVRGNITDARGRAIDGTVTFNLGRRAVGKAGTRGGRFVAFDLAAGTYSVTFRSSTGKTGQANVTVRASGEVTANIRAQ